MYDLHLNSLSPVQIIELNTKKRRRVKIFCLVNAKKGKLKKADFQLNIIIGEVFSFFSNVFIQIKFFVVLRPWNDEPISQEIHKCKKKSEYNILTSLINLILWLLILRIKDLILSFFSAATYHYWEIFSIYKCRSSKKKKKSLKQ